MEGQLTLHEADRGYAPDGTRREPADVRVGWGVLPAPPRQLMVSIS